MQEELPLFHANQVPEKPYDSSKEQPTPEELMLREALKRLTREQRELWEMYAYDKMTQDEIAKKLNKDHSTISRRLVTVEKRITKWIQNNMGAYNLIKEQLKETME